MDAKESSDRLPDEVAADFYDVDPDTPLVSFKVAVPQGTSPTLLADTLLELGVLSTTIYEQEDSIDGNVASMPLIEGTDATVDSAWSDSLISCLMPQSRSVQTLLESAAEIVDAQKPLVCLTVDEVLSDDWEEVARRQFKAIDVTSHIRIVPPWEQGKRPLRPGGLEIVIDRGMAYGSGASITTRLMLKWLEKHQSPENTRTILDYGCGSGVLGIVAVRLGTILAIGTDIDPVAVETSLRNANINSCGGRYRAFMPNELPPKTEYDSILANIGAQALIDLAPRFYELGRPYSKIVLGGVRYTEAQSVLDRFREFYKMNDAIAEKGWVLMYGTSRKREKKEDKYVQIYDGSDEPRAAESDLGSLGQQQKAS